MSAGSRSQPSSKNSAIVFSPEPLDVERRARLTKWTSRSTACAGQIEAAGAPPHHLALGAQGRAAAGRAHLREGVGQGAAGRLRHRAQHLRDHVPRPLQA